MANLRASRAAQWPLMQEFTFDVSTAVADAMPTTVGNTISGASPAFGAANVSIGSVGTNVFEIAYLPVGSTLIGGEIIVETAVVGPTASTISLGDSGSATRYASTVSMLSAARTALTLTGFRTSGENLRMTINNTVAAATAGKVTVRALYTIQFRANEAQTT